MLYYIKRYEIVNLVSHNKIILKKVDTAKLILIDIVTLLQTLLVFSLVRNSYQRSGWGGSWRLAGGCRRRRREDQEEAERRRE